MFGRKKKTALLDGPENVRVVRPDGVEVPCEVFYVGTDEAGIRLWEATAAVSVQDGLHITCSKLPGRTAIRFRSVER